MRLTTTCRIAAVALLAACGGDGLAPDPGAKLAAADAGSHYSATATGRIAESLSGIALGGRNLIGQAGPEFDVVLVDSLHSMHGVWLRHGSSAVAAGTYQVVDATPGPVDVVGGAAQFAATYFAPVNAWSVESQYSTSGTVTIEAVTATRISGRFDVVFGTNGGRAPLAPIRVAGTFDGLIAAPGCYLCKSAPGDSTAAGARLAR